MSSTEVEKGTVAAPEAPPTPGTDNKNFAVAKVSLRVVLLAASITAVVVMVTSKQTETILVSGVPTPASAKFQHSPAFIYFVAALSVAGLYSIITAISASFFFFSKPSVPSMFFLVLLVLDVVMLGIVASATGTAGAVGYIGLKGNSHVRWMKVCNVYDKFCQHVGASIFVSLFAAVVLVILVVGNGVALYRRIPRC